MYHTPYEIDTAISLYRLTLKTPARLLAIAEHFEHIAPLASVASNAKSSRALAAACRHVAAGNYYHAVTGQ